MRFYNINTTASKEEDFLLQTNLTAMQIRKVLTPIVEREREGGEFYSNDELIEALEIAYPNATIILVSDPINISI